MVSTVSDLAPLTLPSDTAEKANELPARELDRKIEVVSPEQIPAESGVAVSTGPALISVWTRAVSAQPFVS
jgi:hypothetical protein